MPAKILTMAGLLLALAMPAGALAKPPLVEPDEGPDPRGLTIQGSGLARVERPARLSEQTIQRAVDVALPAAQVNAVRDARRRARALARAAGLTLGPVQAATDHLPDLQRYAGPGGFCLRRGCKVPPFWGATVRVTFATLETSAVVSTGRAIVASERVIVPARPQRETNPSIRFALQQAQLIADPLAFRSADRRTAGAARAAGFERGPLFALAEEPRQFYLQDLLSAPFGAGRFCGTIRRRRGSKVRRCYIPSASSVLRVTFAVAD